MTDFIFFETDKLGSGWRERFAIVRNRTVYLRVVGDGTHYRVMTATTGEDDMRFHLCRDLVRLRRAATQFAQEHGCEAIEENDKQG